MPSSTHRLLSVALTLFVVFSSSTTTVSAQDATRAKLCQNVNGQTVCVTTITTDNNETCSMTINNEDCNSCELCDASDGSTGVLTDCDNTDSAFTTNDCSAFVDLTEDTSAAVGYGGVVMFGLGVLLVGMAFAGL